MSEIELKDLLTKLYKTAEKIGEIGIDDVTSCDYVRVWIDDEKKVLKMFKKQQTHLNLAVEALEVIVESGHDVGHYLASIAQTALNQIKGDK